MAAEFMFEPGSRSRQKAKIEAIDPALEKRVKKLLADAKNADVEKMGELKKKAIELKQMGLKHDQLVAKIKNSILGAGAATAAAEALRRLGGK